MFVARIPPMSSADVSLQDTKWFNPISMTRQTNATHYGLMQGCLAAYLGKSLNIFSVYLCNKVKRMENKNTLAEWKKVDMRLDLLLMSLYVNCSLFLKQRLIQRMQSLSSNPIFTSFGRENPFDWIQNIQVQIQLSSLPILERRKKRLTIRSIL